MINEGKRTHRKFTAKARNNVRNVIRRFLQDNPTASKDEVAAELNSKGVKHVNLDQWTRTATNNFMANNKVRVMKRRVKSTQLELPVYPPQTKKKTDRVELAELVLAANMGNSLKEEVLKALFCE